MTPIGSEFKRERELRGVSLKEIADATKINIRFLRALEEDNFGILPEKFFTLGIIREYAKHIGLDEKSAIKAYEDSLQAQEEEQEEELLKATPGGPFPGILKNIVRIVLVLATVLIGLALLYYFFLKPDKQEPVQTPVTSPPPPKKDVVLPPSPAEEQEEKAEGLNLALTFQQETWIRVYTDGQVEFTGLKYPGEAIQAKALNEIVLDLGNAGGCSFTLNGKRGKPFGSSGQVMKNIKINLNNMNRFLAEEQSIGIEETGFLE